MITIPSAAAYHQKRAHIMSKTNAPVMHEKRNDSAREKHRFANKACFACKEAFFGRQRSLVLRVNKASFQTDKTTTVFKHSSH